MSGTPETPGVIAPPRSGDAAPPARDTAEEGPRVRPLSPSCASAFDKGEHACLGISPFNGYFTTERITVLARWALDRFSTVHLYMPDGPSALTLEASGYPRRRASAKARRQANYLRNKMIRALDAVGAAEPQGMILDSGTLAGNRRYERLLGEAHALFDADAAFQEACLDAGRWILADRVESAELTTERMGIAARYLLAELPFFTHTPHIVGTASSVFCYHRPPDFVERLFQRRLPWGPQDGQGFVQLGPVP
ncbi:tRNA-dependent cyclodipeptide synthase [Nocardiopsis gilva YIM 90087]|uniref:Cyclodipeptide synthase n=1 Tax=Nocardiopsis gilva YIM 90087 TaxID=1235441 RepID=A0A223S259_9ACTN|nr:tRNA-dependent cyclodipeptide synthase [Nocardiopsis gilva]ASU82211.1 tRNA-dependent cyclodipeptide synthase [Nocardiopsis gilva YIM 90087]